MILVFENPGEIDPLLITTMGVNVKETDSAIGFFGTGLKYAIAISLRLGDKISIQSGLQTFQFEKAVKTVRGKDFDFITMSSKYLPSQTLGFTCELGKAWEPWMAFRELLSNCLDEGGTYHLLPSIPPPEAGLTRIIIQGKVLPEQFHEAKQFFLEGEPIFRGAEVEIFPGKSSTLFYRGIAVMKLEKPSIFTYNMRGHVDLTEDRTVRYPSWLLPRISRTIAGLDNSEIIDKVLRANHLTFESTLNFGSGLSLEEPFLARVEHHAKSRICDINETAIVAVRELRKSTASPEPALLTEVEKATFLRALAFCAKLGILPEEPPMVSDSLGSGVLGIAMDGHIWLSRAVFREGTKRVAGTIIEEHLHLTKGLADCSRAMQNHLFDWIVSLGEEIQGEPL